MRKYLFVSMCILFAVSVYGQEVNGNDLRKIYMKSDVILACEYINEKNYINDFTVEEFRIVTDIDTTIVNNVGYKIGQIIKLPEPLYDYPLWQGECTSIGKILQFDIRYTSLIFIKKVGKEYKMLGSIDDIKWDEAINYYIPALEQLKKINETRSPEQRYSQTIDWFIENNTYPDNDFINFYQTKGIIGSSLDLSNSQLERAMELFKEGNGNLLPFVKIHCKTELNKYYLERLKDISKFVKLGYKESREFKDIVKEICDIGYGTVDYFLISQLTDDILVSEKKTIMKHFITMVEKEISENSDRPVSNMKQKTARQ